VEAAEAPRPYRPVALWFMGIVVAVVGVAVLGEELKKRATSPSPAPPPPPPPPVPSPPAPDPDRAMTFVLRGTVRGTDGKTPAPEALLEFVPRSGRRERNTPDGKGRFTWKVKDPAPSVLVWAWQPGVGLGHVFVQGSPGRDMDQDIVLVPVRARTLELRRGGRPAEPGLALEFHSHGQDGPELLGDLVRSKTDAAGRCSVALPDGAPIRVRARWPDHREALGDVPRGEPDEMTIVVLGEPERPANR
jgi:hypothetical protein